MERVRLDMGALSVSQINGGSYIFFLYKKGADLCLPIDLTRAEASVIIANFKNTVGETSVPTMHMLYFTTLQGFGIELLEITIIKKHSSGNTFFTELLLFDGKKESRVVCSFSDGIVLAKFFSAPIFIYSDVMEKYAKKIDANNRLAYTGVKHEEHLKQALAQAIESENYERAGILDKELRKLAREKRLKRDGTNGTKDSEGTK